MKVLGLLLLVLVAVSSAEVKPTISNDITEYIEIVKCFLNQENLVNDIVSLVNIVKSGEYEKLLPLAFKLYTDGTTAVKECIKKEEINLEGINNFNRYNREQFEVVNTPFDIRIKYEIIVELLKWYKKKQEIEVEIEMTRDLCRQACEAMYIGYQLDMCYSLCLLYD